MPGCERNTASHFPATLLRVQQTMQFYLFSVSAKQNGDPSVIMDTRNEY
jgi:hypothetical protein